MFDLIFVRRTETEGGDDRLAVEEIWAAGIRDQRARDSRLFCQRLSAKQGIEVFSFETNLGAGKVFEIFSQNVRTQFLTSKEGA